LFAVCGLSCPQEHSSIAWSFDDIEVGQMPKAYSEKEVARRNHRRAQTGPPPVHLGFNPALVWNERMFFLLNNYHDAMPHSYVWLLSPARAHHDRDQSQRREPGSATLSKGGGLSFCFATSSADMTE
jgi:hypothetical protein